jgi:cytochrome c oxidase subunit III
MNSTVLFKVTDSSRDLPGVPPPAGYGRGRGWSSGGRGAPAGIGLWAFMGVATALFSLFIAAYVMRMEGADWAAIGMPWQLWLSTSLLAAGSVTLQLAASAARDIDWNRARILLLMGGFCAIAFLGVQLWSWQALLAIRVMPAGNPAGSFFYLLTAMHGLHVIGGLVAWGVTVRRMRRSGLPFDPARTALSIALCARYWHFLLAVWVVLFATFSGITPEVIRFICGTR